MARATAAAARSSAPARRRSPAPARRKSISARPAPKPAPRGRSRPAAKRPRARARLSAIPHSPFIDRLLTGQAWIVLVAGLLAGIVFVNVMLLEMNAGIARTTEEVAAVKRSNAKLRLQAARLGSTERIQRAAADLGLVLPAPGEVRYLEARPGRDAALALERMTAPEAIPVVAPLPAEPVPDPAAQVPAPAPVATEPVAAPPPAPVEPQAAAPPTAPPAQTG